MEKYDRMCCLCCSMLDMENYIPTENKELTSIGAVFVCILDISEVDDLQASLCKRAIVRF